MRKISLLVIALGLALVGCLPVPISPETTSPTSASEPDLQATAAVLSAQTLQALPSPTSLPSSTPVISTATGTSPTETSTQVVLLPVESATMPSGTPPANESTATAVQETPGLFFPVTNTPATRFTATLTETLHPRFYGTLPPDLPFGEITLINRSRKEVYVSLQCTTQDGFVTILEYPVPNTVKSHAPAGKYIYVVWVGGRKVSGSFGLGKNGDIVITIYKDRIGIK